MAHEGVTAPRVVLRTPIRCGELAEDASHIHCGLTRPVEVLDGGAPQLRRTADDSMHHAGQVRNRKDDLPRADGWAIHRQEPGNRPSGAVVQESTGHEVHPATATTDGADTQVDGLPEPGAIHQVDKAIRIFLG